MIQPKVCDPEIFYRYLATELLSERLEANPSTSIVPVCNTNALSPFPRYKIFRHTEYSSATFVASFILFEFQILRIFRKYGIYYPKGESENPSYRTFASI